MKKRLLGLSIILGAALVALPSLHRAMAGGVPQPFVKLCHVNPGTSTGHVIRVPDFFVPGAPPSPRQIHLNHGDCDIEGPVGSPCTCDG